MLENSKEKIAIRSCIAFFKMQTFPFYFTVFTTVVISQLLYKTAAWKFREVKNFLSSNNIENFLKRSEKLP